MAILVNHTCRVLDLEGSKYIVSDAVLGGEYTPHFLVLGSLSRGSWKISKYWAAKQHYNALPLIECFSSKTVMKAPVSVGNLANLPDVCTIFHHVDQAPKKY